MSKKWVRNVGELNGREIKAKAATDRDKDTQAKGEWQLGCMGVYMYVCICAKEAKEIKTY